MHRVTRPFPTAKVWLLAFTVAAGQTPSAASAQTYKADAWASARAWNSALLPPNSIFDANGNTNSTGTSSNAQASMVDGTISGAARASAQAAGQGVLRAGAYVDLSFGGTESGQAEGSAFSLATSSVGFNFFDASVPIGDPVVFTAQSLVSGGYLLSAPPSNGASYAVGGIGVQMGTSVYGPAGQGISPLLGWWGQGFSSELRSNGQIFDQGSVSTGPQSFDVHVFNGQLLYLNMFVEVSAGYNLQLAANGTPATAQAWSDYTRTLRWGGITAARRLDGTALSNYTAFGVDGFDYVNAAGTVTTVPEPSTTVLVAVGALLLVLERKRRTHVRAARAAA